jgi:hypothetical protein
MKLAIAATFGLLCMVSAQAQTSPQPALDLDLPTDRPAPNVNATTAGDPPGKYYGDVDGNSDPATSTRVSGSFSTTVGYAKGYGTGISNSADLNVDTQLQNGNTINMNIGVTQGDNLSGRRRHGW